MRKIGFIIKVKSRGKEYYYLRKAERKKGNTSLKINTNIFAFGQREKALENLNRWKNNFDDFPLKLKDLGYDLEDISTWIEQIESK